MEVADNSKASSSSVWQEELASCKGFCTSVNSGAALQDAAGSRMASIFPCPTLGVGEKVKVLVQYFGIEKEG